MGRDSGKVFKIDASQSPEERLNAVVRQAQTNSWDHAALKECVLVDGSTPGKAVYEFTITDSMCNQLGTFHGGCASTVLDVLTSTTLFGLESFAIDPLFTVTRTLVVTFLRAVPVGAKVRVSAEVVHTGKKMVHLTGALRTLDGKLCITCVHDKAIVTPKL